MIFGRHNVAQDPPLAHIDLVICRNVLIHFTSDLQEKILARFHYAIREGGYLFLGRSESLLARSRWFGPHNLKWRIFQRSSVPAPTVAAAAAHSDHDGPALAAVHHPEGQEALARLPRVLDALPAAVMVVDPMDTILVWNAAAEHLYDIPVDSAIARKFRDLDISYRVEGLRAKVEEVKTKHIPARLDDVTFARRSGPAVHADISIVPVLEGNRVIAVLVYAGEATEQARLKEQMTRVAEQHATAIEELQSTNEELQSTNEELETTVEELQAANAELAALNAEMERRTSELKRLDDYQRAVLAGLEHAVVVLNRDGVVMTWNEMAERMWGIQREQVVGRSFASLPIGDITRLTREALGRVLKTGNAESVRGVPYVVVASGETRRAVMRLAALREGGKIVGVVGFASPDDSGS